MFVSVRVTMRLAEVLVTSVVGWFSAFGDRDAVRRRLARGTLSLAATGLVVLLMPSALPWSAFGGRGSAEITQAYGSLELPAGAPQGYGIASISGPATRSISAAYPAGAKRTALIIGINRAVGSRRLQGAVRDAQMLKEALRRYGFPAENITLLTDGAATAGRISLEIDRLAARTPADGRAVFAFAGHTRKAGGVNQLVAADGSLVSAPTLAAKLGRVRSPLWVTLPTCFSEGYRIPGIVGPNRIATFASDRHELAYELGRSGSWLMIHMVERAMLEGRAPHSIEQAFFYAQESIRRMNPDRAPTIDDRYHGDFALGPVTWGPSVSAAQDQTAPAPQPPATGTNTTSQQTTASTGQGPRHTPEPSSSGGLHVCGSFRYRCSR